MNREQVLIQSGLRQSDAILYGIAETMADISREFLTIGLFMPSYETADTGFLVSYPMTGILTPHLQRTDKYIYKRKFKRDDSLAIQALYEDIPHGASRKFPDQHYCVNHRIALPNGKNAVLQAVFDPKSEAIASQLNSALQAISDGTTLNKHIQDLAPMIARNEQALRIKGPYQENAVLFYIDINGFKRASNTYGHMRANDFADSFLTLFLDPLCTKYGADVVRYEGDGLWAYLPVDPYDLYNKTHQISRAQAMGHEIINNFSAFVTQQDVVLKDLTVKVIFDCGEVYDVYDPKTSAHKFKAGPLFTQLHLMAEGLDHGKHHLIAGPNINPDYTKTPDIKPV